MFHKIPRTRTTVVLALLAIPFLVNGIASGSTSGTSSWPGTAGNPVGYAAYAALGTTPWPGGNFQSGTASSPTVYKGYVFSGPVSISGSYIQFVSCDFNSGTGGVSISGSNITFTGDRFQSNSIQDYNVSISGSNITFSYSSFTPLASFYTSPPGAAWPSAGAGENTITQVDNVNAVAVNKGYEFVLLNSSAGPVTFDHCDFWGFGNAIQFLSTTAQVNITNNWIHDAAQANGVSGGGYHTDGPGYLNGGAGPSNILIQGNTIASLGNTNGIAFQAATSGYNNIQILNNYLSGFGYTMAAGQPGNTHFSNSSIKNNVWGTDVEPVWNPLYGNTWPGGSGSTWACNTVHFSSGTSWTSGDGWTPASTIDGEYWVPTNAIVSTSDYNGNTSCSSTASAPPNAPTGLVATVQ